MEANYAQGDYLIFLDREKGEVEHIRLCRFTAPVTDFFEGTDLERKLMLAFGNTNDTSGIDIEFHPPGSTPDNAKNVYVKINEHAREMISTQGDFGRAYDGSSKIVITNGLPRKTTFRQNH